MYDLGVLAAVPAGQIAAMQRTIARFAHRMSYSTVATASLAVQLGDGDGDAFDIALSEAHKAARSASRVAQGRAMQSTRGLERTKQVEAFYNFSLGSSIVVQIVHSPSCIHYKSLACYPRNDKIYFKRTCIFM